jgi:hypothetical protein
MRPAERSLKLFHSQANPVLLLCGKFCQSPIV